MDALYGLSIALVLATYLSFGWVGSKFFFAPDGVHPLMRAIFIAGYFTGFSILGTLIWWDQSSDALRFVGILFYLMSLSLLGWSFYVNRKKPLSLSYSNDEPQHMVMNGPYRYIRHPFYSAYALGWAAGPLVSGHHWLWIFVAIILYLYWKSAVLEEEKFAQSSLAKAYQDYKQQTGRFLPKIKR